MIPCCCSHYGCFPDDETPHETEPEKPEPMEYARSSSPCGLCSVRSFVGDPLKSPKGDFRRPILEKRRPKGDFLGIKRRLLCI